MKVNQRDSQFFFSFTSPRWQRMNETTVGEKIRPFYGKRTFPALLLAVPFFYSHLLPPFFTFFTSKYKLHPTNRKIPASFKEKGIFFFAKSGYGVCELRGQEGDAGTSRGRPFNE